MKLFIVALLCLGSALADTKPYLPTTKHVVLTQQLVHQAPISITSQFQQVQHVQNKVEQEVKQVHSTYIQVPAQVVSTPLVLQQPIHNIVGTSQVYKTPTQIITETYQPTFTVVAKKPVVIAPIQKITYTKEVHVKPIQHTISVQQQYIPVKTVVQTVPVVRSTILQTTPVLQRTVKTVQYHQTSVIKPGSVAVQTTNVAPAKEVDLVHTPVVQNKIVHTSSKVAVAKPIEKKTFQTTTAPTPVASSAPTRPSNLIKHSQKEVTSTHAPVTTHQNTRSKHIKPETAGYKYGEGAQH